MSSQKPTILHVIDTTGPGGAETVFVQLAAACNEQGMRSLALIRGEGYVADSLTSQGIEKILMDCKGSFNFKYLIKLISLIKKEKVTVIQSHLLGSNVYCSLAGLITRTPVVSTFHGHVDISPNERFRTLKFSIVGLGSRKIIAVTKELLGDIERSFSNRFKKLCEVIPNGIETERLSELSTKIEIDRNIPVTFGCLGNIRKAKNYFLAVDFLESQIRHGLDAYLRIAGDDTKKIADELRNYIESKNLNGRVELLGFINDVPAFFESIDVFLMTSSSEGHPLALTQAFVAAKPVLTTPSGAEKVIATDCISVAAEHSPEALLFEMNKIFELGTCDLESRVLKARRFALENYSIDAMYKKYSAHY